MGMRATVALTLALALAGCVTTDTKPRQDTAACIKAQDDAAPELARMKAEAADRPFLRQSYLVAIAKREEMVAEVCRQSGVTVSGPRERVIEDGLRWIEANSEYKKLTPPRFWVSLDDKGMRERAIKSNLQSTLGAMYSCTEQAIYFKKDADFTRLTTQAEVVHELTHHAQCINHKPIRSDPCGAEREAYGMQAKFLRWSADQSSASADDKQRTYQFARAIEQHADKVCQDLRILR